jgi:plastocyanin
MKKFLTVMAALALASFALAACGSDSSTSSSADTTAAASSTPADTSGGSGETVDVTADPSGQLAWTETKIDAKAGAATVELVNDSDTTHDLVVEDSSGNKVGEAEDVANGKSSFDADLKPGSYTYYCSLPGHREAGMEGTLTVK